MPRQSLSAASRKAAQQARVDRLDSLGSAPIDFTTGEGLTVVEKVIGDFITRTKDNLQSEGMVVTGKTGNITVERTDTGINIMANPSLIYLNYGVNGARNKSHNDGQGYTTKRPPLDAIIDWIEERNIQITNNDSLKYGSDYEEKTALPTTESVAYAIREKIFQEGQPATNVYSKEIPMLIDDLTVAVADFTVKEILNNL